MPEFKVVREEFPDGVNEDGTPAMRAFYTFLVDGVPSLFWQPECNVPGLPKTYYIDRTIGRLKAGRSEAFGPPQVVNASGEVVSAPLRAGVRAAVRAAVVRDETPAGVRKVVAAAGGGFKPREARPGWRYVLDGTPSEESYPSEAAARAACAVRAFMTRGKLGRLAEAQKALEEARPGEECRVFACPKEHGIVATVGGKKVALGLKANEPVTFKKVAPAEE